MDDRILLLPPVWAPVPPTEAASVRALVERLSSFLPLDVFKGPSLRGAERLGRGVEWTMAALREQIRPEHHILDVSTQTEPVLVVLSGQPARSLAVPGFYASPATARSAGDEGLAAATTAAHSVVMQGPTQMFSQLMEGAEPAQVQSVIRALEEATDFETLAEVIRDFMETDFLGKAWVDLPVLLFEPPAAVPAAQSDFIRRFAGDVRFERLERWGLRLHEEEGGIELAQRTIDFIGQVIASRETTAQT